ncbi:hypothetical protein BD311DRAFT_558868 [Dichomitus squalens]|uniref:Uncharacterized protein n=1 Tax=Dichomitus squalens TaxID=114155 RepID=A0A4Q9MEE9_9APHY|nr:hypothetical protein BD311DRAFT_558868 [Dichomitus squalens]
MYLSPVAIASLRLLHHGQVMRIAFVSAITRSPATTCCRWLQHCLRSGSSCQYFAASGILAFSVPTLVVLGCVLAVLSNLERYSFSKAISSLRYYVCVGVLAPTFRQRAAASCTLRDDIGRPAIWTQAKSHFPQRRNHPAGYYRSPAQRPRCCTRRHTQPEHNTSAFRVEEGSGVRYTRTWAPCASGPP